MKLMQLDLFAESNPPSSSGKTYPECSAQKTTPLAAFLPDLPAKMIRSSHQGANGQTLVLCLDPKEQSRGGSSTPNFSEWPNDAAVCSLSQVLEKGSIPPRFFLSGTACAGILRRAEKRGKRLPPSLHAALQGGGIGTDLDCDGGLIARRWPAELASTLDTSFGPKQGLDDQHVNSGCPLFVPVTSHTLRGEGLDASEDGTGRSTPLGPVAFAENSRHELRLEGGDGQRTGALSTGGGKPGQGVPMIAFPANLSGTQCASAEAYGIRTANTSSNGWGIQEEVTHTLDCAQGVAVAFTTEQTPKFSGECALTLTKQSPSGGGQIQSVMQAMQVRRLTPTEAERLMGFPDGYTAIPWRKKPASECPDGPRYRSLGNSWAVPNVAWIGRRIHAALHKT